MNIIQNRRLILLAASLILLGGVTWLGGSAASDRSGLGPAAVEAWGPRPGKVGAYEPGAAYAQAVPPSKQQVEEDEDEQKEEKEGEEQPAGLRRLTQKEVNRIRYMELRGMRLTTERPDRVTVRIPKEAVNDFLLEMEGRADFRDHMQRLAGSAGEKPRQTFLKLSTAQKLHWIAYYRGVAYADKVEIRKDPEVFVEFKANVLPFVLRGCAASGCHAASAGYSGEFRLFTDRHKHADTLYANFLMLNEIEVNGHKLIDRAQPENSLLLNYMLPSDDVKPEFRHPGNVKLKPMFLVRTARQFRRVQDWIGSLKHPMEYYGVYLLRRPTTTGRTEEEEHKPIPEKEREPKGRPATQPFVRDPTSGFSSGRR
jgi:hypothetical protein